MPKKFQLKKQFKFEAAHMLPHHDGKCRRLHGHSWVGYVVLEADGLQTGGPEVGMVMDFGDVKAALEPLVNGCLDHHYLNDTTGLDNPTSEEIARWVYQELKPKLPLLVAVVIQETCTSECTYHE